MRDIGTVLPGDLAIPHMGWNALHFPRERPRSPIFRALEEGDPRLLRPFLRGL